jgi:hypothetical protein
MQGWRTAASRKDGSCEWAAAWRGQPNRRRGTLGGGALRTPETSGGDSTRGVGLRELIWGDLQKVELGWDECGGFKC